MIKSLSLLEVFPHSISVNTVWLLTLPWTLKLGSLISIPCPSCVLAQSESPLSSSKVFHPSPRPWEVNDTVALCLAPCKAVKKNSGWSKMRHWVSLFLHVIRTEKNSSWGQLKQFSCDTNGPDCSGLPVALWFILDFHLKSCLTVKNWSL